MNILYGVQATGNGHISRSREVIRSLRSLGHNVFVIFSGRDPTLLWDIDDFQPFKTFRGLTFSTYRGKVQYVRTFFKLNFRQFLMDIKSFDASGYDLVITDFEPISSQIARNYNLPSFGIGHQYSFLYDIPTAGANILANFIIKNFAPARYTIGLHWHHFNQPILPPIVPLFENADKKTVANKILVYLPFEELEDIKKLLKPFKNYSFFVYHKMDRVLSEDNIILCPYSRNGFLKDLVECCGVITNAGFELVSEALNLGKKLLLKPLEGQMEQLSNALVIKNLRLGLVMYKLDRHCVERLLQSPLASPMIYPHIADMIAEYIDMGDWDNMGDLIKEAWGNTTCGSLLNSFNPFLAPTTNTCNGILTRPFSG